MKTGSESGMIGSRGGQMLADTAILGPRRAAWMNWWPGQRNGRSSRALSPALLPNGGRISWSTSRTMTRKTKPALYVACKMSLQLKKIRYRQVASEEGRNARLEERPGIYAWFREFDLRQFTNNEEEFKNNLTKLLDANLSDTFRKKVGFFV